MLQLKVNSQFVDLGQDPSIVMDEESPVFDKDSIPGGFAFPFSLPVTDRNRRIFQFPERIEKSGPMSIESDFELFHSGIIRASGTISITQAKEDYRAYLAVGSGDFASKIKDKKLNEVTYGGSRVWEDKAEFTSGDDFSLFPIYNPKFLEELTNYDWEGTGYKLNAYEGGAFITTDDSALSFFPFVSYMIKRIFEFFGFFITENIFITDPELSKIVLYSSFDAMNLITVPELKWFNVGDYYNGVMIEHGQFIWTDSTSRVMSSFDLVNSMPDVLISDFFLALRNKFNVAFVFDRYNNVKIVRRDQLLLQPSATDITSKAIGNHLMFGVKYLDGWKLSCKQDEDDQLFAESNFKQIDKYLSNFKGSIANTSLLPILTPSVGDIYYIESLDVYRQYSFVDDIGNGESGYSWVHFSIGFQNFWEGDGKEVFDSAISTLNMVTFQRELSGPAIRCPWTEQLSNGPERMIPNPFSLRFLLYQGLQKDSDDNDIPMGSSDVFDINGDKIPEANLTLKYEGDYGLYNYLWKTYLTWWIQRKQVNFIIQDPSELDFTTKYEIDRSQFLLLKKTTEFTSRSIIPGECEFYVT